jgi:hypothetical protein
MTPNNAVAVPTEALEMKSSDDLGNDTFNSPPDFTFGATNEQGGGSVDFPYFTERLVFLTPCSSPSPYRSPPHLANPSRKS